MQSPIEFNWSNCYITNGKITDPFRTYNKITFYYENKSYNSQLNPSNFVIPIYFGRKNTDKKREDFPIQQSGPKEQNKRKRQPRVSKSIFSFRRKSRKIHGAHQLKYRARNPREPQTRTNQLKQPYLQEFGNYEDLVPGRPHHTGMDGTEMSIFVRVDLCGHRQGRLKVTSASLRNDAWEMCSRLVDGAF